MRIRYGIVLMALLVCADVSAQDFTYNPPGQLVPGSGTGRVDETVYAPDMRFPIEVPPAYPNSQVWGRGGSQGPGGGQCDEENYSYPWWDNYCESRSWTMPLCPSGQGHQGQDIRPSTCSNDTHWTVAAEDGTISSIGSYSLYLVTASGTQHRYLHMAPGSIRVSEGQSVTKGERLGRVSNAFFDSSGNSVPTTIHLHYDIIQNVSGLGNVYVSPYMSLVRSYEALLGIESTPCEVIGPQGATLDDFGPCAVFFGPSQYWRIVDGMGVEGRMHWTNAFVNDTPSNFARWNLHFAEAGRYDVSINVVPPYNRSRRTRYSVRANGEETTIEVDQSAVEEWHSLGEFEFAEGGDQRVEVYDNTGEEGDDLHITADAVRITRVDLPADPDMGGGATDPPDMGAPGGGGGEDAGGVGELDLGGAGSPDAGEGGPSQDDVRTNRGCCATASSPPRGHLGGALLLLLAFVLRRRRP